MLGYFRRHRMNRQRLIEATCRLWLSRGVRLLLFFLLLGRRRSTVIGKLCTQVVEFCLVAAFQHFGFKLEPKLAILVPAIVGAEVVLALEHLAAAGPRTYGRMCFFHMRLQS